MITPELIARINELAKKKKTTGLTPEEVTEQAMLRQTYLAAIKEQFKATLDQIEIVDEPTDTDAADRRLH